MGRSVLKKLKSNEGASLTFALLAFLVCAVISAVLLASASAATGRLSNLAESDQRYYAVTSAAQLFCDTLDGQEFTVERKQTSYQVNVMRYYTDADGTVWGSPVLRDEITYWFGDGVRDKSENPNVFSFYATGLSAPITDENLDVNAARKTVDGHRIILADAALSYVIGVPVEDVSGPAPCNARGAYPKIPGAFDTNEIELGTFEIEIAGDPPADMPPADMPKVTAVAKLRKDGSIVIEFSNNDADNKAFKVTVTLTAEVTDNSALPLTISSDSTSYRYDPDNLYSYVCTVTTTVKTKTTTIKWSVTDIKKGAA